MMLLVAFAVSLKAVPVTVTLSSFNVVLASMLTAPLLRLALVVTKPLTTPSIVLLAVT